MRINLRQIQICEILQSTECTRMFCSLNPLSLCNAARLDKSMTHALKVNVSVRCSQLLVVSKSGTEQNLNTRIKEEIKSQQRGLCCGSLCQNRSRIHIHMQVQERFASQDSRTFWCPEGNREPLPGGMWPLQRNDLLSRSVTGCRRMSSIPALLC